MRQSRSSKRRTQTGLVRSWLTGRSRLVISSLPDDLLRRAADPYMPLQPFQQVFAVTHSGWLLWIFVPGGLRFLGKKRAADLAHVGINFVGDPIIGHQDR
jgi:hypothetical protein